MLARALIAVSNRGDSREGAANAFHCRSPRFAPVSGDEQHGTSVVVEAVESGVSVGCMLLDRPDQGIDHAVTCDSDCLRSDAFTPCDENRVNET